jgi:CarD family transcriptional regulator
LFVGLTAGEMVSPAGLGKGASTSSPPRVRPPAHDARRRSGRRGVVGRDSLRSPLWSHLMDTFKVGDKAVYPAHGVAEVVSIERKEISGHEMTFYVLKILDNGMKVMIPTSNVKAVGMREIISSDEADEVFKILRKKEKVVESTTWNRRYREYMEKIKTGSVFEVAKVLRDLYLLKGDKDLSFGERKMLDTARSLLVKEISISKQMSEEEVETEFRTIFKC